MTASGIYHEKQVRELCGLHALNNLFQSKGAFTKAELDLICISLSPNNWINPHRSMLGLGNYDINVIMKALQDRGYEGLWFDKRRDPTCLILNNICGFIVNIPTEYKLGFVTLPLWRRHWITIREINGYYYNLDSKLDTPKKIGAGEDVLNYLKDQIDSKDTELFLVVTSEVSKDQSWIRNTEIPPSHVTNNSRDADVVQLKDLEIDNNL